MLLEFKGLHKNYGQFPALRNINLQIGQGKIVGLLGANGSGKTTMIKLINDLLKPTSGEVLVNGKRPGVESKRVVSYLPERTYLEQSMKVCEVVDLFQDFYENFNREKALRLLSELNIDKNKKMKTLSKGTKEKVQLVLVMSREADLYVLDEPIGGVDPAAREHILDTIISNFKEGASIIISTHLIADIERILDDVVFIANGEIVLHAEADKLRTEKGKSIDAIFKEEFRC